MPFAYGQMTAVASPIANGDVTMLIPTHNKYEIKAVVITSPLNSASFVIRTGAQIGPHTMQPR